jgi:hypothetical protein
MKKNILNLIVPIFSLLILLPSQGRAADIRMSTYYPSISGEYYHLRLLPRSADLTGSCVIGTLYVNSSNSLQYCRNVSGVGTWGLITGLWTQNGDTVYLTDGVTNPSLQVGVGTATPEFKLTLINDAGIIATGTYGSGATLPNGLGAGSRLIWYPRKAAFRAGYVSGTQWDNANIGDYSAALGKNSTASGAYSVVGGGDNNTASGQYSNVIGGQNNIASGDYSAITGGLNNTASGLYTTVTGGQSNSATANYTTILGGQSNQATALYATVSGGNNNIASAPYASINGGQSNDNTEGLFAFLGSAGYPTIGGGKNNSASNDYTVVSGGENNTAGGAYASVGGGKNNTYYIILPGDPRPSHTRISGGEGNRVGSASYTTVSGGKNNIAMGSVATVGGGFSNQAAGALSTIGGGESNVVSTIGNPSMIMGGSNNIIGGEFSWAEGKYMNMIASADRTFVWGYSDTPFTISDSDAFIIAPGTLTGVGSWNPKVGIRDISPTGVLEINANGTSDDFMSIKNSAAGDIFIIKINGYIGIGRPTPFDNTYAMQVGTNGTNGNGAFLTGDGQWNNASSRKNKEKIEPLSSQVAQQTLDQLKPVTFNYKVNHQTNAGFIAEDVPDIVAMNDRASLSAMDIIAVLTKAAQDQQKEINEQSDKIKKIRNEIQSLKSMLSE